MCCCCAPPYYGSSKKAEIQNKGVVSRQSKSFYLHLSFTFNRFWLSFAGETTSSYSGLVAKYLILLVIVQLLCSQPMKRSSAASIADKAKALTPPSVGRYRNNLCPDTKISECKSWRKVSHLLSCLSNCFVYSL